MLDEKGYNCCIASLNFELSNLGLIPNQTINCRIGASQAGRCTAKWAIPRIDLKLGSPSASVNWSTLKIQWRPLQRVDVLSPAPWSSFEIPCHLHSNVRPGQPAYERLELSPPTPHKGGDNRGFERSSSSCREYFFSTLFILSGSQNCFYSHLILPADSWKFYEWQRDSGCSSPQIQLQPCRRFTLNCYAV